jgi:cytoskeletal protein CcmA (bactofilin family)
MDKVKFKEDHISIINKNCRIEGNLNVKGHLIVEGIIDGYIQGESIFAEAGSHLNVTVQANILSIAGFFDGEIEVDTLSVLKTADVKGNIRCRKLIVDEGGMLNGTVKFLSPEYSQEG